VTAPPARLAAVILTGGTGARLGGADKASIEVAGRTLLEHTLEATAVAAEVVVVGPQVRTSRPVTWTREDPPGGGPAAGLLAGVRALAVAPDLVCALAVDMVRFSARTLDRLLDDLATAVPDEAPDGEPDGACLVDAGGRLQWLAGVYRYDALLSSAPGDQGSEHGLPIRRLMLPLRLVGVPAIEDEADDVDTWEDLLRLRE